MSEDRKSIKKFVCPSCFAREIDVIQMHYDEEDDEYYCPRCAYAGNREQVEYFFKVLREERYKQMREPHPFAKL